MSQSDLEGSCVLSDLEGRGFVEVGRSCLELEGSCRLCLLEMDWLGLEGMVGTEGHGEGNGMLVLAGHLGMEMGRLKAGEDRE